MDFETITTALVGGYAGRLLYGWYQGNGFNFDIGGDIKRITSDPVWSGLPFLVAWLAVAYTPEMLEPMAEMAGGYLLPTVAGFATMVGERIYFAGSLPLASN